MVWGKVIQSGKGLIERFPNLLGRMKSAAKCGISEPQIGECLAGGNKAGEAVKVAERAVAEPKALEVATAKAEKELAELRKNVSGKKTINAMYKSAVKEQVSYTFAGSGLSLAGVLSMLNHKTPIGLMESGSGLMFLSLGQSAGKNAAKLAELRKPILERYERIIAARA